MKNHFSYKGLFGSHTNVSWLMDSDLDSGLTIFYKVPPQNSTEYSISLLMSFRKEKNNELQGVVSLFQLHNSSRCPGLSP